MFFYNIWFGETEKFTQCFNASERRLLLFARANSLLGPSSTDTVNPYSSYLSLMLNKNIQLVKYYYYGTLATRKKKFPEQKYTYLGFVHRSLGIASPSMASSSNCETISSVASLSLPKIKGNENHRN